MPKELSKEELLENVMQFEVEMPMLLEDLQTEMASSKNYKNVVFDLSVEKIDQIEQYYLDLLRGKEQISCSQDRFDRIILAYLGEVVLEHVGGRWEMGLEDDFTYGTPMIYGFKDDDGIGFSPVGIRKKLIRENTNGIFSKSLNYCINKAKIEADLMRQMEALA